MKKDKKNRPEREKGAAPPDYLPAIFGWMSSEDMEEQAKEIIDFTKEMDKKKKKKSKQSNDPNIL